MRQPGPTTEPGSAPHRPNAMASTGQNYGGREVGTNTLKRRTLPCSFAAIQRSVISLSNGSRSRGVNWDITP